MITILESSHSRMNENEKEREEKTKGVSYPAALSERRWGLAFVNVTTLVRFLRFQLSGTFLSLFFRPSLRTGYQHPILLPLHCLYTDSEVNLASFNYLLHVLYLLIDNIRSIDVRRLDLNFFFARCIISMAKKVKNHFCIRVSHPVLLSL